ncbi:MAG: DUF559 domain-containing protein, partial [Actinomycetota bacterium]|nr:DUF559 domain-containing protein [Actinomycetota bacterium]
MPRSVRIPDALTGHPFTLAQARATGVSRRSLQGLAYRRLGWGVYVPTDVSCCPEVWLAAARLRMPPDSAISGLWAARIWGVDLLRPDETDVEVTRPRGTPMIRGGNIRTRRALMPPTDVALVNGFPVTSEYRTAFDLARRGPRDDAVIALDAMLYARLISRPGLRRYIEAHPGWCGVRLATAHFDLASDRVESPMETRIRLVLHDAGLPRPAVNESVCDKHGRFLARPDLRIKRVLIEFDGAVHRTAQRHREDVRRQNLLIQAGFVVLRYTA